MLDYIAPIEDTARTLRALHFETVMELDDFLECSQELVDTILEEAGKFAAQVFAPLNRIGDTYGSVLLEGAVQTPQGFKEAYHQYVENAWLSLAQDSQYGGQGMPFTLHMAVTEFWNAANVALALNPMLTAGAIDVFKEHASEELKQQYLAKLISGQWTGTMNLTEPHAGSDLSSLRTKASIAHNEELGEHYLIKGQKIFITWGDHDMAENIVHLVLAPLDDAPKGVKGLSLFAVPKFLLDEQGNPAKQNDIKVVSIEHKLGIHASPTCVMSFGENDGAIGYLIGEAGQGLSCMFTLMNHARLEVGLEGAALSERAYQAALAYSRERIQGRHPITGESAAIIEHADVQRMLLTMKALSDAMRGLCLDASISHDMLHHAHSQAIQETQQHRFALLTPVVKAWCTELVNEVTSLAVQVHGGMGYIEETGVAQYLRDARITSIYEGTTGIQANDLVGRKLIQDKGESFAALMQEIQASLEELSIESTSIEVLSSAKKQLEQSANYIISHAGDAEIPTEVFTGLLAYDFLMQFGYVLGAWYHLRYWDTALQDAQMKLVRQRAEFYVSHILPRASSHASAITSALKWSAQLDSKLLG